MGCKVILIRHGLTYWNARKMMQGQVNIPLNDAGVRQARDLARQISPFPLDVCYASPLGRSLKTAQLALEDRNIPIIKDERLIEHGYGLLESTSYRRTPWFRLTSQAYNYECHPERYRAPIGGETFEDVYARARSFIDEVLLPEAERHDGILVAGHGGINCAIMGCLFDIPLKDFWSVKQANCGYTVIDVDNGTPAIEYSTPVEVNAR